MVTTVYATHIGGRGPGCSCMVNTWASKGLLLYWLCSNCLASAVPSASRHDFVDLRREC